MTNLTVSLRSILLIFGLLSTITSANDRGLECPTTMPEDLSPCTFDSRYDPSLTCDYESKDCCPGAGCAEVHCQCLLSVFVCIVDPLPCQELCPETKPSSTDPCDFGVGIDCLYGDPVFCSNQQPFFYAVESVCYCYNQTFSCNEFACKSDGPTSAPTMELTTCPSDDPWKNISVACSLDEGTMCDYGEFCCPNDNCVPDTTCWCKDNIFVCEQRSVVCQSTCPDREPASDATCALNPRYECEYDFGMCEGGDTTKAARGCACNYLDETFICFDKCNSTDSIPSTPSSSPNTTSGSPLSDVPSSIPSPTPSDIPSAVAPSDSEIPAGCPDDAFLSVSCTLDSNITCRYPRFRCMEDVVSPASCRCEEGLFVCIFDDVRCNSNPVSMAPSTLAPAESIPTPTSAAFAKKALSVVACLVIGLLIV